MSRITFTHGSRRYYIAQYAERGVSWTDAYYELKEKVLAQTKPWVFTNNAPKGSGGKRRPMPLMSDQLQALKDEIRRVYARLDRASEDSDVDMSDNGNTPVPVSEPKPDPIPHAPKNDKEFFWNEWNRIRDWIAQRARNTGANEIDSLAMRPLAEASRAIDCGISAKTLLHAMVMHWPEETRRDAGIQNADFHAESDSDLLPEGLHRLTGYVAKLASARIPIMLVGPSGTGKSQLLRRMANQILDMPYGETPMTAGATPSWLLGRETLKGYQISHFLKIYTQGGVFNFEEIDASDPNMLIVMNNALSIDPGDDFFNPVNGEAYTRSADFIAAATANTFGQGANATYTGRERLDFATIDRFRMGRVYLDLDMDLARSLILS